MPTGNRYRDNITPAPVWKWKMKHNKVNVEGLDPTIIGYLNTLETKYQDMILATAGTDGKHSEHSRHYTGNAIDLRVHNKDNPLMDELYKRMEKDPVRLQYGITLLDPRHGNAPHLHLSTGEGHEDALDVWKQPHTVEADKELKNNNIPPTFLVPFSKNMDNGYLNSVSNYDNGLDAFTSQMANLTALTTEEENTRNKSRETNQHKLNLANKMRERNFLLDLVDQADVEFIERRR